MNETPVKETQVATEVKTRKKRERKASFKSTRFDMDLLGLLREGVNLIDDLVSQLGVAKSGLIARLDLLVMLNLVTEEPQGYALTIDGYNYYVAKSRKKISLKKAITGDVKLSKKREAKQKDQGDPINQKSVKAWLSSTEVVDLGGKLGRMDLQEIMKLYGPTDEQKSRFLQNKAVQSVQPSIQTLQVSPQPRVENNGETCDLCKSGFKMSMQEPELAKYGHCFCGAVYHKECYNSLLSDTSKCVRCGKKLLLIIDKQSREVINKIKDAFE